ncbi:PIN domain-containing protein [Candidatus Peregrinibacteria bacterium]|nr:PIN domain-containing protein [Candidatus Peregrinibacteria bacterium]
MNIVDSSAWLEYFADTKNAKNFAAAIENTKRLLVPSIVIYEVFKKVLIEKDENLALKVAAHMKQGRIIDVDLDISLSAAKIRAEKKLPMADSIIYACSLRHNATVWTQDKDFKGLKRVKYFEK